VTTSQPAIPIAENGVPSPAPAGSDRFAQRALVWFGIASASALLTFLVVRATMRRAPVDPTSARIQSLIDEANRLLRALDDQKR